MIKTYLLTLLAPLLGGGNLLIKNELNEKAFFNKDYTTVLKGIACLVVIYIHVLKEYRNPIQEAIGSFAYVCVTLFFLVSAYGMMLSVEKKADYLKGFWRNRLLALLIPCLLINVVDLGFSFAKTGNYHFQILCQINSYVLVLFQWCVWFYVVEFWKKRSGLLKNLF